MLLYQPQCGDVCGWESNQPQNITTALWLVQKNSVCLEYVKFVYPITVHKPTYISRDILYDCTELECFRYDFDEGRCVTPVSPTCFALRYLQAGQILSTDGDNYITFYRATLYISADFAVAPCLSVCLSVSQSLCPPVTFMYCIEMAEDIVKLLSQPGSTIILFVFERRYPIPKGTSSSRALNIRRGKNLRFLRATR